MNSFNSFSLFHTGMVNKEEKPNGFGRALDKNFYSFFLYNDGSNIFYSLNSNNYSENFFIDMYLELFS